MNEVDILIILPPEDYFNVNSHQLINQLILSVAINNPIELKNKDFKSLDKTIFNTSRICVPTGILSIMTYLRSKKINVGFLDLANANTNFEYRKDLISIINLYKPSIVAFSIYSFNFDVATKMSKLIKKNFESIITLAGGPHITATHKVINSYEFFDYIVPYNGEYALEKIFKIKNKPSKTKVIIDNRINSIPIDYSIAQKYQTDLLGFSIFSSYTCPFKCKFCAESHIIRKAKNIYAPQKLIDELRILAKTNFEAKKMSYHFLCSNLTLNQCYLNNFVHEFERSQIEFCDKWEPPSTYANINSIKIETLKLLERLNVRSIQIGVESFNDNILKISEKSHTSKAVYNAFKVLNNYNNQNRKFNIHAFWLIGLPGETIDSFKESLNKFTYFIRKNTIQSVGVSFFIPYPGIPFLSNSKQYRLFIEDHSLRELEDPLLPPVYELDSFKKKQITDSYLRALKSTAFAIASNQGIKRKTINEFENWLTQKLIKNDNVKIDMRGYIFNKGEIIGSNLVFN